MTRHTIGRHLETAQLYCSKKKKQNTTERPSGLVCICLHLFRVGSAVCDQYRRTENDKSAKAMRVLNDVGVAHLKVVAMPFLRKDARKVTGRPRLKIW